MLQLQWLQKDSQINKQGTAGKRKHGTLTIPQKFETIRRLKNGENQTEVVASHDVGSPTAYHIKTQKDQSESFMTLNQQVKRDIQMEYSSDELCNPSIGVITKEVRSI
jgi:hypothetical protein